MSKQCVRCGKVKSKSEFYKIKNRKDGCYSYCKECALEWNKEYRQKHPEKRKEWQINKKEYIREYTLKRRYGITAAE